LALCDLLFVDQPESRRQKVWKSGSGGVTFPA